MIQPIMYFGIGFLVAALFGLLFVPLVHNRAVRLTMRRLEAATPLSIAEIRADKDQLRAEFAMSTRRLEMSVEQMKARTTNQLAELGKKADVINQLKKELGEKTATIFALEARDKGLKDQLNATEEEFAVKTGALREAERGLSDKEAELSKLLADLGERTITADSQRVELAALRTQVEAMKVTVTDYECAVKDTEHRLNRERADAEAASKELTDARAKVENLATRTAQLERQLVVQTTEAEILGRRVQELETRLGDQGRLLAEREYELDRIRAEVDGARKSESELRAELAATTGRGSIAADKYRADISTLEAQLAAAIEDRAKLQRELSTMKRDAEASWAAERVENALLRERINDVAAEVARLTAALEGPNSPIDTILASETPRPHPLVNGGSVVNGTNGAAGPALGEAQSGQGTLADRIRALQSRASRVASRN